MPNKIAFRDTIKEASIKASYAFHPCNNEEERKDFADNIEIELKNLAKKWGYELL